MKNQRLGVFSGMGMVIANMIGAGVFLSTGFMMAQDMNAGHILLAWFVGMLIAMTGAKAYSGLVRLVPQSGGEYRFLSALIHPALGYFAGWASLLIGFSAPIAISAMAAGAFAGTLHSEVNITLIAVLVILALTAAHAVGMRISITAQNSLVAVKIILLVGFIVAGLIFGNNAWPEWTPPNTSEEFPLGSFMRNLFYIAFAFSGWNAAIYAASEFKNPKRDVPRAMVLGCLIVGILYLFVNWIFVANLTPEQATIVFTYETDRITLGHLIMQNILGDTGAACMSIFAIIAFISSASAMTFLGPRVYAAMAEDGFLPRVLKGKEGKPPVGAVLLQGAISLLLVLVYQLQEALSSVGAILTLFSALTVFSLFWICFRRREYPRPAPLVLIAGALFFMISAVMLYFGFTGSLTLNLWVGISVLAALTGYRVAKRKMACRAEQNSEHGLSYSTDP
ncbi:MAG: amino acid permease [Betaproteobacteria bacterium]|nr:amino acid permease [Betaproteobacteria bacterium]